MNTPRICPLALILCALSIGCGSSPVLTAEMPLHLEEHLDAATITGSAIPSNPTPTVEWQFDQPQPEWKPLPLLHPPFAVALLTKTPAGLLVTTTRRGLDPAGRPIAGIYIDVPGWIRSEWADVLVRARADSTTPLNTLRLLFNRRDARPGVTDTGFVVPFQFAGQGSPIVRDGAIHTYRLRVAVGAPAFKGPWQQLVLGFTSENEQPGSIEILSVSVVPTGATYAAAGLGVHSVTIDQVARRTLVLHTPARLNYRVNVPPGGRLDAAFGIVGHHIPVNFRVTVRSGARDDTLLAEHHSDADMWAQRSIDLSKYSGKNVTLTIEANSAQEGSVALLGAPTVSGSMRRSKKPNVILYIIDGGGADYMSVYGYNRRTTPNLEKLAAEGALFENAYSTSSWTKPSTATFMTSLQTSVLGNNNSNDSSDPLSLDATTMAEHFHRSGYGTAALTANPNALWVSGLERHVDLAPIFRIQNDATSSVKLHNAFWNWREASPGQPYWVHFQTTDVHSISRDHLRVFAGVPAPPFAGLFVSPEEARQLRAWSALVQAGGTRITSTAFSSGQVNRVAFHALLQGLWDEQMAHNDYQIGKLVERLKLSGEWENTILVVSADHSIGGSFTDTHAAMLDTMPPSWNSTLVGATVSHVPLLIIWPGHIRGGQRFRDPVSLIDLLPTVLELAELPQPDVSQGQSLAPLLLGKAGWKPRPVILDEVNRDPLTGIVDGEIAVVDGRWGASLEIGEPPADTTRRRPWSLLLYDLWSDPFALHPVNENHSDVVKKYTAFLEQQWKDHQLLAIRFTPGAPVALTPEQLERLRALGYIR